MTDTTTITTMDKIRAIIMKVAPLDQPPENDQALFYDGKLGPRQDGLRENGGYGMDSLDRVEVAMFIEEDFNVEVPDRVVSTTDFNTVQGIARAVDQLMLGRSAGA